jgi:hypothetical protein
MFRINFQHLLYFFQRSFMKICAILALTLLFLTSHCFSQNRNSFLSAYNNQTIYRSGNKYTIGNERITYGDLEKEFTTARTRQLYRISKKRLGISRVFSLGSLAVVVTSIFFKKNVWGSVEFAAGSGILSLVALSYQTQSSRFVDRAIWERNRDVLSGSIQ